MEELAKVERELWDQSTRLSSRQEYLVWERKCDECLESLEGYSRAKRPRLSIGIAQSLIARISRLEGLKNTLRTRFVHVGAGYSNAGLVWREIDTAFNSRVLTGAVINVNYIEPRQFLEDAKNTAVEHVQNAIERHDNLKVNTIFNGEFVTGDKRAFKNIHTRNCELFLTSNLQEWYEQRVIEPILASLEEFQERDSGWALSRILDLIINVNKYNPLHAGCHIVLPREIQLKRAIVNVQSTDNACFAWAVVAALYPADKHADRTKQYPHYTSVLNLQDIVFPMTFKQIKRFEQINDISINIYTIREKDEKEEKTNMVAPIRLTDRKMKRHINLLYIPDLRNHNVGHFAWIKNLSRLVSSQLNKNGHTKYICNTRSIPKYM